MTTLPPSLDKAIVADGLPDRFSDLEREAFAWVMQFARGRGSTDDLSALQEWARQSPEHAIAFDRVSRTWKTLGTMGDELDAEFPSLRPARNAAPTRLGRRAFLGGAVAASAAGAAFLAARPPLELWPSWSEMNADYRTGVGERRELALAENVSIDMNTRTSIANGAEPELISGEAVISISRKADAPFALRAAGGRIVASDARFNIRSESATVYVTCLQGAVTVERLSKTLPLPAGRQVAYSSLGLGSTVKIDTSVVRAWQDGVVIFQSTPIADVIAEVNRYRSGRVILTNRALGQRLFNARLRITNIDRVVGQIVQAFGARATTLPGGIVLLG
jgi:transmembrane sensor